MSLVAIRLRAEPVRSIAFGSIGVAYMGVGSAIDHPASQIFIQNLTNETLMFSLDGVNDHFPLPASGFFLNDIVSNRSVGNGLFLAQGDRLYVKQIVAPTGGSVYFTVFYASEN